MELDLETGWRITAIVLTTLLAITTLLLARSNDYRSTHHVSDDQIRSLCKQYAYLDLSGMAGSCIAVHYQEGP